MQENNLFFSVMLHIGTLSAVLAVYFKTVIKLFSSLGSIFKKLIHRTFVWKEMTAEGHCQKLFGCSFAPNGKLRLYTTLLSLLIHAFARKEAGK